MGFGVVTMIGFDLAKTQVDDIAIKTTHSGFILEHKLGPRCRMDQVMANYKAIPTSIPFHNIPCRKILDLIF